MHLKLLNLIRFDTLDEAKKTENTHPSVDGF